MKRVAIVGCGASALACAITLAKAGITPTIFEQNSRCGKKILVSGNGKCNIANRFMTEEHFRGNRSCIRHFLKQFDYYQIKAFFDDLGLDFFESEDGRVFPASQEAKTVVELFENIVQHENIKIFYQEKVQSISKDFVIKTQNIQEQFDIVVLANGTQAATHLGGNTSGYEIAKSFGHTIKTPYPLLVQFLTQSKTPKIASGAKVHTRVSLVVDGEVVASEVGDLLFSDYGLSGLAILDLSFYASKMLLDKRDVEIVVHLLEEKNHNRLSQKFIALQKRYGYSVEMLLHLYLPKKIVQAFLHDHQEFRSLQLNRKSAKRVLFALQNWKFKIVDTKGFRYAEVSGGGINCHEIDVKSFESKKQKNLYIIGELLDVVGKRGGYNFAFAWGSGILAARSIIQKV